uniref:Uncharacterized protein n=1 Tax=Amphimedon queenslandica TaxID=400682 RepID=A0A1X7T9E4_AMPQE
HRGSIISRYSYAPPTRFCHFCVGSMQLQYEYGFTLIGRVVLGQEACVSEFVLQLPALASDAMFHSFAICCNDLCSVIGPTSTEEVILPYFIQLCKDEVWAVRKDLDDVKTGVLAHLLEFFEVLPSDIRKENFPSILNGILDTENEKNWRYRDSLAE